MFTHDGVISSLNSRQSNNKKNAFIVNWMKIPVHTVQYSLLQGHSCSNIFSLEWQNLQWHRSIFSYLDWNNIAILRNDISPFLLSSSFCSVLYWPTLSKNVLFSFKHKLLIVSFVIPQLVTDLLYLKDVIGWKARF